MQAFRQRQLPVVLVNVVAAAPGRTDAPPRMAAERPADWADLAPALNAQPSDHRVSKRGWGAFLGTDLEKILRAEGATQIVLAGISTSIGVESTARDAYQLGFNVALATDAMTDMNADAHHNSISLIFPRLGECGSTADILALLAAFPA